LTGATFAIPIISGFYTSNISNNYLLGVLIASIAFAIIMYLRYTFTSNRMQKLINSTDVAFLQAIEKLNHFRHYFDTDTYPLDKITESKLTSFFNYYNFASFAAQAGLMKSLQNMINSKDFSRNSSDLHERWRTKRRGMRQARRDFWRERDS